MNATRNFGPVACALAALALLVASAAPAASPVELRAGRDAALAWPAVDFTIDQGRQASVSDIAGRPASDWAAVPSPHHHWGAGGDRALWARLRVRNVDHPSAEWMLVHEQTFVDRVAAFVADGSGWRELRGTRDAASGWLGGTLNPAFALSLPPGAEAQVMVRTDTVSHLRFPLKLVEASAYHRQERGAHLFRGMILVIPLVATFFIFLLWVVTREPSLPVFIGMNLAEVVGAAWISGMLHALFPGADPAVLGQAGFACLLLAMSFAVVHARLFLNLDAALPRLALVFKVVPLVLALLVIPELLGSGQGRTAAIVVWVLCTQLLFAVSLVRARHGQPFAGTYALAWGTYLLSAGMLVANLAGLVPPNLSNTTLFVQGSIVSLVFCFAAVGQVRLREHEAQQAVLREHGSAERARARTRLFAAANHDMRQPVQSLGLFIELLRQRTPATDIDGVIARLRTAYLSLSDFLDGLMSVVQLEAGTLRPQVERLALDDLLQPLIAEYREQARAKHLSLRWVPTSVEVLSDRRLLERILRNLLANAVRYTESGRLLVGVRRRAGGRVALQVLDTGVGFTVASRARAFDEFTRFADGSDGVGLGLANVRGLCRLLGHEVSLASAPGRGSCFSIVMAGAERVRRRLAA